MSKPAKNRANGMNTHHWRGPNGLRARALRRDHNECQIRLPGCTITATTVHINPALNGNHRAATLDDCVSACHRCHGRVDGARSQGGVSAAERLARSRARSQKYPPGRRRRSREW